MRAGAAPRAARPTLRAPPRRPQPVARRVVAAATPFNDSDCPYATLGVSPTATKAEIKAAFRAAARAHHPDVADGCSVEASSRFMRVADAYALLTGKRRAAASKSAAKPTVWDERTFDFYWSFVATQTARRRAAAAGKPLPPRDADARGPAPRQALESQLAGLRARAARKAQAGGGRSAARAAAGAAGAQPATGASPPPPPPPAVDVTTSYYDMDGASPGDSVNAAPRAAQEESSTHRHAPKPPRAGACADTRRAQIAGLKRRAAMRARDEH